MLLALEAAKQGDTLEARGSLQRSLDARPEVVRFLHVPEGHVTSVAFGPEGRIAAGYGVVGVVRGVGGVVLFDARGERLRPTPLEVKEGDVKSVAFGPEGKIAAGYRGGVGGGGVVLFDARGERLRPAPLEVKEGSVTSVAFGPEGQIAAGYGVGVGVGGGVVLFDARGERLRPAPLEVKEGHVTSVAFGPEGKIAAGYGVAHGVVGGVVLFDARGERLRPAPLEVKEGEVRSVAFGPEGRIAAGYGARRRRRRGALRRPWRAAPTRAAGGQGGRCHERGLRAGGQDRRGIWRVGFGCGGVVLFDARGERLRPAPLEVKEGDVTSVAFGPEGKIAAGYGARRRRRRRGALRRPWRAAPTRAAGGQGGRGHERGLRAGGPDRRGICGAARRRRRGALRRPGRAAPTRAAGGQGGLCHERGLRAGGQDRRGISRDDVQPFSSASQAGPGQSLSRILQSLTVAHTWRHHRRQEKAATSGRAVSDPRSSRTATTCSSF